MIIASRSQVRHRPLCVFPPPIWADSIWYVSDPDKGKLPIQELLGKVGTHQRIAILASDNHIQEYLAQRAKLFDPSTASRFHHVSSGVTSFAETDAHPPGQPRDILGYSLLRRQDSPCGWIVQYADAHVKLPTSGVTLAALSRATTQVRIDQSSRGNLSLTDSDDSSRIRDRRYVGL